MAATPTKILDVLFPPLPKSKEGLKLPTTIETLQPMTGLHYACLERIGHALVMEERALTMAEYAIAYLLLWLPAEDAHAQICREGGPEELAAKVAEWLAGMSFAETPRIAREVNAACSRAFDLAPKEDPEGGDPLAAS